MWRRSKDNCGLLSPMSNAPRSSCSSGTADRCRVSHAVTRAVDRFYEFHAIGMEKLQCDTTAREEWISPSSIRLLLVLILLRWRGGILLLRHCWPICLVGARVLQARREDLASSPPCTTRARHTHSTILGCPPQREPCGGNVEMASCMAMPSEDNGGEQSGKNSRFGRVAARPKTTCRGGVEPINQPPKTFAHLRPQSCDHKRRTMRAGCRRHVQKSRCRRTSNGKTRASTHAALQRNYENSVDVVRISPGLRRQNLPHQRSTVLRVAFRHADCTRTHVRRSQDIGSPRTCFFGPSHRSR